MSDIEGRFQRVSPSDFAEKTGIPIGWFVINHHLMPDKANRRAKHGRWYRIDNGSNAIYRILRFSPRLKKSDEVSDIVLDWVGWLDLHDRTDDDLTPLKLEISEVGFLRRLLLPIKHPDPGIRMSGWLAYLSLTLGGISLLLGLLPLL